MEAPWVLLSRDFPAKKAPPPLENWMMTGDLASLAASKVALMVDVDVQLVFEKS